jgi:hypothetical protein
MDNMTYMHQLGFRPIFTDGVVSHWTTGWTGMNGEPIQQTISDSKATEIIEWFGHLRPSYVYWMMLGWEPSSKKSFRKGTWTINHANALKQWRRAKRHARQLAQMAQE